MNLDAMLGGWYIVATIPHRFEKGMVAPYDVYAGIAPAAAAGAGAVAN